MIRHVGTESCSPKHLCLVLCQGYYNDGVRTAQTKDARVRAASIMHGPHTANTASHLPPRPGHTDAAAAAACMMRPCRFCLCGGVCCWWSSPAVANLPLPLPLPLRQAACCVHAAPALPRRRRCRRPYVFMTRTTSCHSQPDTYPSYTHPRALGSFRRALASAASWCPSKGRQPATCKADSCMHWTRATA